MTSLGQFCPMLYSINGQSLSWDSPSTWLRRYQLNIRFRGSVFLVPCPRHLSFTRSESWLNLSQPFLPWPKLPLTLSPGHQALPLGLRRTSYFMPPFWQRDASKGDRMSLLRLGHQRLTMGLLAHHCTCSHSLSQSLSSPVKGHHGKIWWWTPTDMMRHWWFLVQPVMNWDPQFKNLERAKSIYQLIDPEAISSPDKGLDDNSFHWHLMATFDRLKAPSQCFPNL